MAKMTPTVRGDQLVYQHDEHEQVLVLETPAWYAWLESASTFAFTSEEGTFTARKERAGNQRGGWYWKAYRMKQGKLSSRYLGKSETLSLHRLQAAAQALTSNSVPDRKAVRPATPTQRDPLLATKLHVPRPRRQLVSRPALIKHVQEGVQGPLTLVSAPAGFGKTTLLAQWVAESGMPVAWLSLEPQDNDPVRFLASVLAALQQLDPDMGTTALALLHSPQPVPPERVLAVLTDELTNREAGDFALVLDDYHAISAAPIHRSLIFLLEHLPPQMHLVLATRADGGGQHLSAHGDGTLSSSRGH